MQPSRTSRNIAEMTKTLFLTICLLTATNLSIAATSTTGNPSSPTPSADPLAIINNFYQFALLISGLLAFGAIVYGGIKYILAAGNPSGQTEGREWIKSALLGLLLLVGAYLVLHTINPNLTKLSLPALEKIKPAEATAGAGAGEKCGPLQCTVAQKCERTVVVVGHGASTAYRCVPK